MPGERLQPSNPGSRSSWETAEYWNSTGLDLINASQGYAARSTGRPGGQGITVAVLDDGVYLGHSDMRAGPYDSQYAFAGAQLPLEHGTPVAGIIAGRRNGFGTHGVAYAANIISIATCKSSGGCTGDVADISSADETAADIASAAGVARTYGNVASVPAASSHIINMSFAYDGHRSISQISSAMRDAARAGRIMVAALGNEAILGPSGAPASNVGDPGIAGWAIAVGALDPTGTRDAGFSNTCHGVAQYCLFAPGERVYTITSGGGYANFGGTSAAAPMVSGAAAAVWAAFPNKRGDQIVRRLLDTASPLGGFSFSEYFGHGALNLGAALSPVGFLSLSTAGGGAVPVHDSHVTLPPGFSVPERFKGLTDTVVYDEQMFPFYYDLAASFQAGQSRSDGMLSEFLTSLGNSSSVSLNGTDVRLEFAHEEDVWDLRKDMANVWDLRKDMANGGSQGEELDVFRFNLQPRPGLSVAFGRGFGSIGSSNDFIGQRTQRTIFNDEFTVAPFAAFAGRGSGLTVDWELDDATTVDFVGKSGKGYQGSARTQLASLGLAHKVADGVTVGVRYGRLQERGSLMGIQGEGAFRNVSRATTDFVDLSVNGRVSDRVSVFGGVSRGITRGGTPDSQSSLVSEWSDARADSFLVGTEFQHLLRGADRLTLTASSPLRADSATVYLDVPDQEVSDSVVSFSRRAVELTPSGREYRLQWVYEVQPDASALGFGKDAVSVAFGSYARMEPGHDETADPEFGAAAKVRARF